MGVASGVVYWHSVTEQVRGVGGGITAVVSLGHFFGDIIDKFSMIY